LRVKHGRLDPRRNFFSIRVTEDWNNIPAEEKSGQQRELQSHISNSESDPDEPRGQMRELTDPERPYLDHGGLHFK